MKEVTFSSFVPVAADVLWRLRHSFDLDKYVAEREGRKIVLHSQVDESREEGVLTRRTSHCSVCNNPLPGWARKMVDADLALQTIVESTWYADHFDERRCCSFAVATRDPRLDGKLEIEGRQWLVPVEGGCNITTRVRFAVRVAVFGQIAEALLASEFGKCWNGFPAALEAYLRDNPGALNVPGCVERAVQTDSEFVTLCLETPVRCEKRGNARCRTACPGPGRWRASCWRRLWELLRRRPRAHIIPEGSV